MPVLVRYAELPAVPWVNGRGVTTELVSFARSRTLSAIPLPAWRLSIAGLDGPAPFSPLPGTRRVFLPVGTDVTLAVNGTQRRVPDRVATSFDGEDVVELVDMHRRPAHAVNLMYRPGAHGTAPGLTVGRSDEAAARTCLVAVALETRSSTAMFDAFTVDDDDPPKAVIQVVTVTAAGLRRERRERSVRALENADVPSLIALLTEDVVLEMPPVPLWYAGRRDYERFIERVFALRGVGWRMLPVSANGQPGVAAYCPGEKGALRLHTVQILTVTAAGISHNVVFQDPSVLEKFGLATVL